MSKLALSAISVFAVVSFLSGCGQAPDHSISEAQPAQVVHPVQPMPVPDQGTSGQPMMPGATLPDGSVNYDQPGDRNVTVNAPFSDTRVDRDTGSVHIDAPFVHIDKAGRGQKMHIDIGGDSADNSR